ncbi:hypothetical protein Pfo_010151 [Paulownia fortunei]|nr:hypothetical protein Pfo_010151 [Paulownia fortunei]
MKESKRGRETCRIKDECIQHHIARLLLVLFIIIISTTPLLQVLLSTQCEPNPHLAAGKKDSCQDNEVVEYENKEIPKHNGLANKHAYSSHGFACCPKANILNLREVEPDSHTFELGQLQYLHINETHKVFDSSDRDMTACAFIQDPSPVGKKRPQIMKYGSFSSPNDQEEADEEEVETSGVKSEVESEDVELIKNLLNTAAACAPTLKGHCIVDGSYSFFVVIPSTHPHVIMDEDHFKSKVHGVAALLNSFLY